MVRPVITLAAAAVALVLAGAGVQAQERVRVGALSCDISPGIGLIIGSQRSVNCLYTPANPGPHEIYSGAITKFGLDIGATAGGHMVWTVWAPTSGGPGALAGTYIGASAEATVAVGLGANVLIGGSNRTVALQPISVQGQVGLNIAVGVAGLELRSGR